MSSTVTAGQTLALNKCPLGARVFLLIRASTVENMARTLQHAVAELDRVMSAQKVEGAALLAVQKKTVDGHRYTLSIFGMATGNGLEVGVCDLKYNDDMWQYAPVGERAPQFPETTWQKHEVVVMFEEALIEWYNSSKDPLRDAAVAASWWIHESLDWIKVQNVDLARAWLLATGFEEERKRALAKGLLLSGNLADVGKIEQTVDDILAAQSTGNRVKVTPKSRSNNPKSHTR
jgi:hypothetical protein